jgi:hypothetical protein
MPTQKPKKTYRILQEPASHGHLDRGKIRKVAKSLLGESTEEDKPRRKGGSKNKRSSITDALADLAAAGKVRLPTKKGNLKDFKGVKIKGESISETVIKDREHKPQKPAKQTIRGTQSWTLKVRRGLFVPLPKEIQVQYDVQAGDDIDLIPTDEGVRLIFTKNRPRMYKKLWAAAANVFKNEDDATLWLHEPQFGLDGIRPIDLMRTKKGDEEVENLLYQIGHGIVT